MNSGTNRKHENYGKTTLINGGFSRVALNAPLASALMFSMAWAGMVAKTSLKTPLAGSAK